MAEPNPVCGHCGEDATNACSGCSAIKYCSLECQQADWQWHKHLCKEFASFKIKPTANSRLVIYIPETSTKPQFVWLEVDREEADDETEEDGCSQGYNEELNVPKFDRDGGSAVANFRGLLGDEFDGLATLVVGDLGSGQRLDHSIHLRHRDLFVHLPANLCLNGLIGSRLGAYFKGPLVLYGMTKVADPRFMTDLHPSDFTFALKELIQVAEMLSRGFRYIRESRKPDKVKGVKLTPEGTFENLDVPLMHPIFEAGKPSEISKMFTSTLLTWQSTSNALVPAEATAATPATAYLHLNINNAPAEQKRDKQSFGSVPEKWSDATKTVLIVLENERNLSSTMAEMTCSFCRDVIQPLLKDMMSKDTKPAIPSFPELEKMWVDFVNGRSKA